MALDPTWYTPVCDQLMQKIHHWYTVYDRGTESASRKWITMNARIVDRVTMYAHVLKFKTREIDHLVRLMEALSPHPELTADFKQVRARMQKGRLYPGNEYEVTLNFYKQDVVDILNVLIRAKTGQLKTVEQLAKEQAAAGKGMFE